MADTPAATFAPPTTDDSPSPRVEILSLPGAPPQEQIEQLLPAYIARQRWFGGKSRRIASAQIASSTPIPGTNGVLTTVSVQYEDGGPADLYQLPLALASAEQAGTLQNEAPRAVIVQFANGGVNAALYDATASAEFRTALLRLIADSGAGGAAEPRNHQSAATRVSNLAAERATGFHAEPLLQAPSRVGTAEQSNTSIIYGDDAILKLFRRLRHGENPDVEISRFLTETARFGNIPAYLGELHLASDHTTLAFLQQFARNQGDGWDWTIGELNRFYGSVNGTQPPAPDAPMSQAVRDSFGGYLEAAALLGRRTGEMHLALATPTNKPAFKAEPYSAADLDADRVRIGSQADAALDTLAAKLSGAAEGEIAGPARDLADALLAQRDAIRHRATDLAGDPATFGQRIRIHGDYHLGQLLRSGDDFLLVDFEGEPAKTLEERRRKQTPLKDVAGMLRSFSYAARSALDQHLATQGAGEEAAMQAWAELWEKAACGEYLRGYGEATANATALLPGPAQAKILLSALQLEKALYELLYELNNRPTWLHIPLQGLLALAAPARS